MPVLFTFTPVHIWISSFYFYSLTQVVSLSRYFLGTLAISAARRPNRPHWLLKFRRLFDKNVSVLNWKSKLCQSHIVWLRRARKKKSLKRKQKRTGHIFSCCLVFEAWRTRSAILNGVWACAWQEADAFGGPFDAVGCRRLNPSSWRGAIGPAAFLNNNKHSQCAASW